LIKIELQRSGIDISSLSIPIVGERLVRAVTGEGFFLVRQETPRGKTERLVRSISKRSSGLEGEIRVGEPYGIFVASGTKPHIIRPVRASALRFEVAGQVVFAKRVQHPGTKPNPFVKRAVNRLIHVIPQIFETIWNRTVK
jgi:beta-phosphoglucomutase-like phosphatase (HAD superfamily)